MLDEDERLPGHLDGGPYDGGRVRCLGTPSIRVPIWTDGPRSQYAEYERTDACVDGVMVYRYTRTSEVFVSDRTMADLEEA